MAHELALAGFAMESIEQPIDRLVVAQRVLDHAEMRRRDAVAYETLTVSLGRADEAPGQSKIDAGPSEQARQKKGAADVGQKADADLRHAKAIALPRH